MNLKKTLWGGFRTGARFLSIGQALFGAMMLLFSPAVLSSQASNQSGRFEHGFSYSHDEVKEVPWSIHVLKIERNRSDLEFQTTLGQGSSLGMGLVSDQARALSGKVCK